MTGRYRDELEDEGIPNLSPGQSEEDQLETGDPDENPIPPSAHPVNPALTTAQGQLAGESLDDRLAQETPDEPSSSAEEPGQIPDDANGDGVDEEAEMVGHDVGGQDENAPEERAMHLVDEPPGGVDGPDSYLS